MVTGCVFLSGPALPISARLTEDLARGVRAGAGWPGLSGGGQACRRDGSNWPCISSPSKLALPVAMETEFPGEHGTKGQCAGTRVCQGC